MSTSELCRNKVANQSELFEIIKFYYGEYKAESDILKSTQMIHELMIFILFNLDIDLDINVLKALGKKMAEFYDEIKSIKPLDEKLYREFKTTIDELGEALIKKSGLTAEELLSTI